jgi:hypothetical protein
MFFGALLRGHLMMQLVHRVWADGLEGNSPELQDLVRPLQAACADPSLPSVRLIELAPMLVSRRPCFVAAGCHTPHFSRQLAAAHHTAAGLLWSRREALLPRALFCRCFARILVSWHRLWAAAASRRPLAEQPCSA